jgi:hypothetical protein
MLAVQNREIEIHDSELDRITFEGVDAVLHFPYVYIHASEGRPGIDAGTGWGQEAVVRIGNARVEGSFSEESRAAYGGVHSLSDGALTVDGCVHDNAIPIPLDVHGHVELKLECWGDIVRVFGNSVRLELVGSPEYIEEFSGSGNNVP